MKSMTTIAVIAASAFAGGLGLGSVATLDASTSPATGSTSSRPNPFVPSEAEVVVARVNGVAITRSDVQLKLDAGSHEAVPSREHERVVLDALITREAIAQKARALGLGEDPGYVEASKKLGAQVRAFERQELSELLLRRESERRGTPTEESARAYFEQNRARITTELHVFQILRRSEAQAIEVRNAIQNGTPFEEVAAGLFPGLPADQRPWDLGFMSFSKVPEPWRETVYELSPGETSGIIRGPNERFWIIEIVEAREDPSVTFESAREAVLADMARSGGESSRAAIEAELRGNAKVEILIPAP